MSDTNVRAQPRTVKVGAVDLAQWLSQCWYSAGCDDNLSAGADSFTVGDMSLCLLPLVLQLFQ